ncbi:hypothetical protein AV530_002401 [Patagioenas fasciata monilis]|uniref:Uncharacterized protein n=1 Tax=Patagioenas fasciata monilis TaxID=372326 RepID=A0A1V4K685_PATFA|nr:hypothetical protein AV530_002401 [Patagioenas fasciata monilis]
MGFSMFTQFLFKLFELQMLFNMLEVPVKPSKKALRFTPVQTHPSKGLFPSGHLPPHLIREIQAPRLLDWIEHPRLGEVFKKKSSTCRWQHERRLSPRIPVPLPSEDHLRQAADFSCSCRGETMQDPDSEPEAVEKISPQKFVLEKRTLEVFGVENPAIEKKACHKIKADKDNHNVLKMVDLG